MTIGRKFNCMGVLTQKKYEFVEVVIMGQATFYYKNSNAPNPNKPNHIGATILINYCLNREKTVKDVPLLVVDCFK